MNRFYCYTVTGTDHFPLDMLRYDKAWPMDSHAVSLISDNDERSIRITSRDKPHDTRWASFGWRVTGTRRT